MSACAPSNYKRLPDGLKCRCINLFQEPDGSYWCCNRLQKEGMNIPRRCQIDLMTPGELVIRDAMRVIESLGAHPLLTDAVVLLGQAQEKVADYVDRCPTCEGRKKVQATNPNRAKAWEVPCPDCS